MRYYANLRTRRVEDTQAVDIHHRLASYHASVSAVMEPGDFRQADLALVCGLNAPSSAWNTGIDRKPPFKSGPLSKSASCSFPSPTTD